MEALKQLYAPDAVMETPDQGSVRGRDAIAAYVGELMTAFPDASYQTGYESGDDAIDEGFFVGTHTPLAGPDGEGIAPTGKAEFAAAADGRFGQRWAITRSMIPYSFASSALRK
jgi:hypothetical protein